MTATPSQRSSQLARPIQRVLLVDDCEADNVLHTALLQNAGFTGEIISAESGPEALAILAGLDLNVPTWIVLDINMPGMNGFEFARMAGDYIHNAPVFITLLVSLHSAEQDRAHAAALPLIRHTALKPLTVAQITELLRNPPLA